MTFFNRQKATAHALDPLIAINHGQNCSIRRDNSQREAPAAVVPTGHNGNDRQFAMLCKQIGAGDLLEDLRFTTNGARSDNREALKQALEERLAAIDCKPLADMLNTAGVPCAPILSIPDALAHPHTAHREMVVRLGDEYTGIATPIKLGRTPATYRLPPPGFDKPFELD